jgi:hypothetical protein
MATRINGIALGALGTGSLFAYAGIKGYSVPHAIQALITGKAPSTGGQASPVGTPGGGGGGVQTPTGPGSVNPTAGTWTHSGLVGLWQMAGGSASSANNAACHAIQESSGNASVTSPNPKGGTNVGLWQLDTQGAGAGHTVGELQNPLTNARITVQATHDGQDWSQWSTSGC